MPHSHLDFSCQPSSHFVDCYLVDEANSLRVSFDGKLSVYPELSGLGVFFSVRRLQAPYINQLLMNVNLHLSLLKEDKKILHSADLVATFLSKQVIKLTLRTRSESELQQLIGDSLSVVLSEPTSLAILNEIKKKKNSLLQLMSSLILKPKQTHQFLIDICSRQLRNALSIAENFSIQQLIELQSTVHASVKLTQVEQMVIDVLQNKVTQYEMDRLEKRKVTVNVLSNLTSLKASPETRGQYISAQQAVYITPDSVKCSLIHEIQHALELDISLIRPVQFFHFFKQCKTIKLAMTDEAVLQSLQDSIEDKMMLVRAKYILNLYNYPMVQRNGEILAHLRQFIADFGVNCTKTLLPNLFDFWEQEIMIKQYGIKFHPISRISRDY